MSDSPSALLAEAQAAARSGDRERARSAFYAVIDREPDNLEAWLWLGAIAEDPEDAVAYLQRALEINPRSVRARQGYEWASARLAAARPAALGDVPPPVPELPGHVLPGVDTTGMQPMTQPLTNYQRQLNAVPPTAERPARAAETAARASAPAGSQISADVHTRPQRVETHGQMNSAPDQAGQTNATLPRHQRAAWAVSQRAEAQANIGFARTELGSSEAAATAFRRAVEDRPMPIEAWLALGDRQRERNDWSGARSSYERALALDPGRPEALYGLALCHTQQGQRSEAIHFLKRAIELWPSYPEALAMLRALE